MASGSSRSSASKSGESASGCSRVCHSACRAGMPSTLGSARKGLWNFGLLGGADTSRQLVR